MRKMRSSNVGNVGLDLYLCCKKQRNNPRIHHKVCEDTCRYLKNCLVYRIWFDQGSKENDGHREDVSITNKKGIKKKKRKKPKLRRKMSM